MKAKRIATCLAVPILHLIQHRARMELLDTQKLLVCQFCQVGYIFVALCSHILHVSFAWHIKICFIIYYLYFIVAVRCDVKRCQNCLAGLGHRAPCGCSNCWCSESNWCGTSDHHRKDGTDCRDCKGMLG